MASVAGPALRKWQNAKLPRSGGGDTPDLAATAAREAARSKKFGPFSDSG